MIQYLTWLGSCVAQRDRESLLYPYIGRASAQLNVQEPVAAYERLMKAGLSRHHWNEYVFLAYVNHREDCVYLAGLPDLSASLPHSKAGQARWED